MRIAIITPYFREDFAQIAKCAESVAQQQGQVTHFLIADGNPMSGVDSLGVRHIALDQNHNDFGNTPRAIGGLLAASEGFDAIGFLDADNWLEKHHISSCMRTIALSPIEPDFLECRRRWVRIDGSVLPYEALEDQNGSHVDTNCMLLLEGSIHAVGRWALIPRDLSFIGDRIFLKALRSEGLRCAINPDITINYLCTWANVFEYIGEIPPDYTKSNKIAPDIDLLLKSMDGRRHAVTSKRLGFQLP